MSDTISIQVDEGLIRRVQEKFGQKGVMGAIEEGMARGMLLIHGGLPPYPPAPPRSTYRRTGTLGREITTETRAGGNEVTGVIGAATVYAPYVIDRESQAWMHVDRWWTLNDQAEKGVDDINDEIRTRLMRLLE